MIAVCCCSSASTVEVVVEGAVEAVEALPKRTEAIEDAAERGSPSLVNTSTTEEEN